MECQRQSCLWVCRWLHCRKCDLVRLRERRNVVFQNQTEWNWCCTCYSLLFTSGPVAGKEMIVQVINTAYVTDYLFVLQIPGSGWGSSTNGCPNQFNTSSWGNQQTGFTNRSSCADLPISLRAGCYWRFDWFMNANNPSARFKEVTCPTALTTKSGCIRT